MVKNDCFQFSSPLLQQFIAALHVHSLPQTKANRASDADVGTQFSLAILCWTALCLNKYDGFSNFKKYLSQAENENASQLCL